MQSADASTNWDFTEVINFLRTPTKSSFSYERDDSPIINDRQTSYEAPEAQRREHVTQEASEHRRLGDFSALWDALRDPEKIRRPAGTDKLTGGESEKVTSTVSRTPISKSPSKPVSILKRQSEVKSVHGLAKPSNDPSAGGISDSTAENISDGDLSIFDSPVQRNSALAFVPFKVHAVEDDIAGLTPPSSCEEDSAPLRSHEKINEGPTRYKSAADRKAGLMLKLGRNFPEFIGATPPSQSLPKSQAIHVFVDASNISIGLHDSYKIQHNVPVTTHIRRLPLSFHNFSLILERGRPVAKRVLAGSDRFPAINEAEKIGYEVNILSRVHKAKEYTPRQLKARSTLNHGDVLGPEMGSPPERWVEQCVDEILHLKMLESLVDTDTPATIVLATGDAAEAEFSGGFLRMVERALQKGWNVELVSFAKNTSFAYKRNDFRAKWKSQFRMINLEHYVEEMLDM